MRDDYATEADVRRVFGDIPGSTRKLIGEVARQIALLEQQRKNVGEEIKTQKARIKALGIPTDAFDFACKLWKMPDEERAEWDLGLTVVRKALEIPSQYALILETAPDAPAPKIKPADDNPWE